MAWSELVLGGVCLLVLGLAVTTGGAYATIEQEQRLADADPVTGEVVETDLLVVEDDEGEARYRPVVRFEYRYDGERFESANRHPTGARYWGSEAEARAVLDRYAVGDEVTVHVPPEEPDAGYLERERSAAPLWLLGGGLLFSLLGTVGVGIGWFDVLAAPWHWFADEGGDPSGDADASAESETAAGPEASADAGASDGDVVGDAPDGDVDGDGLLDVLDGL